MNRKLAQAQQFFQRNVCEFVESVGAVSQPCDYAPRYELQTKVGSLEINVFEDWIACRFEDVKAAAAVLTGLRLNRYSGKWNWHYPNDPDTLNNGLVIGDFVSAVESLIIQ